MAHWRNRPISIDRIKAEIPWIIAIDESGSSDLSYCQRNKNSAGNYDKHNVHFNVTACLLATKDFEDSKNLIMDLKYKYWDDGLANYNDELRRVCFHSSEIRRRKNAFSFKDKETSSLFLNDLTDVLRKIKISLFSAHINKLELVKTYHTPFDPYELALTFILERIGMSIQNKDAVIILESRGKKEDKKLLRHIREILDNGTGFKPADDFSFVKGVYFNGKWDEKSNRQKSHWILELADLYCYPIFKYGKEGEKDIAFKVLERKLNGYPRYNGIGLKKFP